MGEERNITSWINRPSKMRFTSSFRGSSGTSFGGYFNMKFELAKNMFIMTYFSTKHDRRICEIASDQDFAFATEAKAEWQAGRGDRVFYLGDMLKWRAHWGGMRGCPQKGRRKEQNQLNSVFDQGVRGQLCLGGAINSFRTLMALNVAFRIRIREWIISGESVNHLRRRYRLQPLAPTHTKW